jgi:hypothetical protein
MRGAILFRLLQPAQRKGKIGTVEKGRDWWIKNRKPTNHLTLVLGQVL